MSKILLTGAAGFIGREIHRQLADSGYIIDLCENYDEVTRNFSSMDKRYGFIYDLEMIEPDMMHGYDFVIHCGAVSDTRNTNSELMWEMNYKRAVALASMTALSKRCKFIFFSSASVYGNRRCDECLSIDDPTIFDPQTLYSMTKLSAENAIRRMYEGRSKSLDRDDGFLIVRPFNVYGPGEYTKSENTRSFVYRVCDSLVSGKKMDVHSLDARRDFIHVDDVALSIVCLVRSWPDTQAVPSRVLNLGTGHAVSILEVLRMFDPRVRVSNFNGAVELPSNFVHQVNPHGNSYQSTSRAEFRTDVLSWLGNSDRRLSPSRMQDVLKRGLK